jgi:hypothetical protein
VESFNGKLRDELLNVEIFDTFWEAKVLIERWRREYNQSANREVAKGVQPETASQRLGLSAAGAGGQTPQVTSTRFCSVEWISSGPRSNLEGGLVPGGGRS